MTPIEAYNLTLEKIEELKKDGVKVQSKPPKSSTDSNAAENPDGIPPKNWIHVSFKNLSEGQILKVHETANYLGMCGIRFDTGGCCDGRDWELDWSFQYTGEEDEQWREAREDVEELIKEDRKGK